MLWLTSPAEQKNWDQHKGRSKELANDTDCIVQLHIRREMLFWIVGGNNL